MKVDGKSSKHQKDVINQLGRPLQKICEEMGLGKISLGGLAVVSVFCSIVLNFFNYEVPWVLVFMNIVLIGGGFILYLVRAQLVIYVMRRLLESGLALFVIATLTFMLLRTLPGGPFDEEKPLPPEVKANIEAKYKLNEPLHIQYGYYISGLLKGDLGTSYKYTDRGISEILSDSLPNSLQLGVYALVLSYLIGIPLGLVAAARQNTTYDHSAMFLAMSGISMPNFVLAAGLVVTFCFWLPWFPVAFWDGPEYYFLPTLALGVRPAAVIARLTRATALEVIHSDYIRTARAKGLSEASIRFKHVLKNSLIPVLTFSGPLVAGILTGSFVIEMIFNIPGMGKHFVQSVTNRDYPLILGVTLVYSSLLIISNLLVDLMYTYFDPRIKLS